MARRCNGAPCETLETRLLWNAVPAGPEFVANTTRDGFQILPQVAADDAGNFVTVWASHDSEGESIRGRLFGADGSPRGDAFRIDAPGGRASDPSVAMDDSGRFVVAWSEVDQAPSNGRQVFVQRFDAAGQPQGDVILTAGSEMPAVAVDADGTFAVTYRLDRPLGAAVAVALYAWDGRPLNSTVLQSGAPFSQSSTPGSVAMDAAGNHTVAWTEFIGNSTAFFQRFAPDGTPRGAATRVFAQPETPAVGSVTVAMNDAGATVFAAATLPGVFARAFDANGQPSSGRIQASTGVVGTLDAPVVVADDGSFVVGSVPSFTGAGRSRARCFDADGSARGDEFVLSDVARVASLAQTPLGGFVAAMQGPSTTPVPEGDDVFVRRFVPTPVPAAIDRVYVNGTDWTPAFRSHLEAVGMGSSDFGYAAGGVPDPLPLTWTNVDQLSIAFTRDVPIESDDMRVTGAAGGPYRYEGFEYDPDSRVATWTFDRNVPIDRLTVVLGAPDFDQTFRLNLLPGDADRNGRVNALDAASVRQRLRTTPARPFNLQTGIYDPVADLNADALMNALDQAAARRNLNEALPDEDDGPESLSARSPTLA